MTEMTPISFAFLLKPLNLPSEKILPSKILSADLAKAHKYRQIRESIREIGLIEPLSIGPLDGKTGKHFLLDGHIRLMAMKELGHIEFPCLVASDDETYTYNHRINRLSTIQEHLMIRRAVDRGVSIERLTKVLCLDTTGVQKRLSLLDGICPEAAELLKNRSFSLKVTAVLRNMKPTRQVECAELMISANTLTMPYARSLLMATAPELLLKEPRRSKTITREQIARMEKEMKSLQSNYKAAEQTYGDDMLNLVLARGYLVKMLENAQVGRFLMQHQPEVLTEFTTLVQTTSLDL
jgi:hypothetical protein